MFSFWKSNQEELFRDLYVIKLDVVDAKNRNDFRSLQQTLPLFVFASIIKYRNIDKKQKVYFLFKTFLSKIINILIKGTVCY